ncbi:hypothetical protein [Oceanobacillus profundus]|uniref:Uncharacterized protein n=1 Tax=Oceanobacillus profundus TaxID=372463 RepID=A0A417YGS1_9BACI|nr:hypothetical protein [Oceanobacillus profundus]MBR2246135.1 hypothetical protein [Bacilli bacterium]MBR3119805.1 hypothetical protein [Oceanobacillus sp.]RHW31952.1 hypothetical protein D1B32_11985 [Oceanobacillus profundus]
MREIEEMEQEIKDKWFNNHEAKITEYDGITILDWREPGTSIYSVRYIFCGSRLYVSGDIGDAIFNLTWIATPQSFNNIDLGYLLGKLSCHSRERWYFDERKAKNDLKDWYEENTYDAEDKSLKEAKEIYKFLKGTIESVCTPKELERELFNYYMDNSFYYFDGEDFSILSEFGKKLPMCFVAYLLGIKLANEQLKVTA